MDEQALTSTASVGRLCSARRRDGSPCRAWALAGSEYCLSHSPEAAPALAASRRKGGAARHGRSIGETGGAPPVKLETVEDALQLLSRAATDALLCELSLARSRTLASVVFTWAKVWESSELERRVQALERRMDGNT